MKLLLALAAIVLSLAAVAPEASAAIAYPTPALRGYYRDGDAYRLVWGYTNPNAVPVDVPVGATNYFSPLASNQGQPTTFAVGRHFAAFTTFSPARPPVGFTWNLLGSTATFTDATPNLHLDIDAINAAPYDVIPFVSSVETRADGSATAHFGYLNRGTVPLAIAVGATNFIGAPLGSNQGQPTDFSVGVVEDAFSVTFPTALTQTATWTLLGQQVTAVVPEPASLAGLALIAAMLRRRRRD